MPQVDQELQEIQETKEKRAELVLQELLEMPELEVQGE